MVDGDEVLVPTGMYWIRDPETGYMEYFSHTEVNKAIDVGAKRADFNPYIEARCAEVSGGCGASIEGETVEDAIAKWNRRI